MSDLSAGRQMCIFVLPKVDYVLITSLFVCIKMITMLDIFPSFDEPYEVIVCNGTVWQRMVLFYCNHERRNVYGTN